MNTQHKRLAWVLAATLALAGCGGGGGSSDPATPPPAIVAYPLQSAYGAWITQGSVTDFTVSGTCTGTATLQYGAAVPGTLDGATVRVVQDTLDTAYSNCTPATGSSVSQTYYNASNLPLATATGGAVTGRFLILPTPLPLLVQAGDSGQFGSEVLYSDSTLAVVAGRIDLSYEITADTASSVIATLVSRGYDASNRLVVTQQTRFRLGSDGSFVPVALDLQYSVTSTTHLVFTKT